MNRWRRRTHHPFSVCWRLLKGELYPERNRYRDVLILILVGVTAWAVVTAVDANHTAGRAVAQVQEGRSTAISIICAVQSGTAQAGRDVIDPPSLARRKRETPAERRLEAAGYPSLATRQRSAARLARTYAAAIGGHIAHALEARGKNPELARLLLRPDGTLNCGELLRLSNVHTR